MFANVFSKIELHVHSTHGSGHKEVIVIMQRSAEQFIISCTYSSANHGFLMRASLLHGMYVQYLPKSLVK